MATEEIRKLLQDVGMFVGGLSESMMERNPSANLALRKITNKAMLRINDKLTEVKPEIRKQVIAEITGLKGAVSLIKRVTGREPELGFDDESEVGLAVADKLTATGLQGKVNRIHALYEDTRIRIDICNNADEIVTAIGHFRMDVARIMAEEPNPMTM